MWLARLRKPRAEPQSEPHPRYRTRAEYNATSRPEKEANLVRSEVEPHNTNLENEGNLTTGRVPNANLAEEGPILSNAIA